MKDSGFIHEIKRRRVLPVIGGYLVAAWVLIQVSDVVVPALALPDVWIRVVLIILIIGFPIAIILAWAFDITADGIKRTLVDWHDVENQSNHELESNIETSNAMKIMIGLFQYFFKENIIPGIAITPLTPNNIG